MSRRQRRAQLRRRQHASLPGRAVRRAGAAGGLAVAATLLSGSVAEAATLTVTNTNDSGAGSLRAEITAANTLGGSNGIVFQSGLSGSIDLQSSLPTITSPLTITGPGARTLTIDGQGNQIFDFDFGTAASSDMISGLSITGGKAALGGAVYSSLPQLILEQDAIHGNTATEYGGGVTAKGALSINQSTISGNTAAMDNGGINALAGLVLADSTVAGNSAEQFNGGIGVATGTTLIQDSTISGNYAGGQTGGLGFITGAGAVEIDDTIVSGNLARYAGPAYASPDLSVPAGTSATVSFSLIGRTAHSGVTLASTDRSGTADLGPLANNGGPTDTMMPADVSPAVDGGKAFGATQDQRGMSRTYDDPEFGNAPGGDGTDIGAVEVQTGELNPPSFMVMNTNDSGAGSLRAAIAAANAAAGANDTITFEPGLSGTIDLQSSLPAITAPLTVKGPGARTLTIDGHGHRVFDFSFGTADSRPVTVSGLSITGGNAPGANGGAIFSSGPQLIVDQDSISGNSAEYGGGVAAEGQMVVEGSTISGNTATADGAGIFDNNGLTLTESTVAFNTVTAGQSGGGVFANFGPLLVEDSTIADNNTNPSGTEGGGIMIENTVASATLRNTIVSGNDAEKGPDAYLVPGTHSPVPLALFSLIGDPSQSGITVGSTNQTGFANLGPLEDNGGPVDTMMPRLESKAVDQGDSFGIGTDGRRMTRPVDLAGISNPIGGGDGADIGAVELQAAEASPATFTVTNTNDSGSGSLRDAIAKVNAHSGDDTIAFQSGLSGSINLSSNLPRIYNPTTINGPGARTLTINGEGHELLDFASDEATSPPDTVSGLTLTGGSAYAGGAVYAGYQQLALHSVTISGNNATTGGGVSGEGIVSVDSSTISGNTAVGGGGVAAAEGGSVSDSTIAGNTATGAAGGGGIETGGGSLTVVGSTISGNHANGGGSGGGISVDPSSTSALIQDSIVAGNTAAGAGPDVFRGSGGGAVVPSASFSSLGSTSGSGITPDATDLVGKDPLLGPLQNNGGPTDTMLPADSSPVIDAGKAFALAKDQRGDTRPTDLSGFPNAAGGDGTDIGSVEVQPSEVLPAIGALSPSTGQAGAQVVITGTHLGSATQVLFGSTPATFTVTSDTKITAAAPSGSGTVDVRVIAPGGESVTGAADQFTYTSQATSRTTTGTLGDQQLTLTTPAVKCVSATAGLPVTFTSTAKPSGTHLKFRRVAFYIDKGIRHTVKKRRGHERVTVARYVPNAISHHVPTTVRLKLTGLKSGPHTLKVVSFYSKALHKRRRKQTVTVSKKLRVSFTIC